MTGCYGVLMIQGLKEAGKEKGTPEQCRPDDDTGHEGDL